MSEADRERWDARYTQGTHGNRTYPSAYLAAWFDQVAVGGGVTAGSRQPRALDIACGTGRNAIALARSGFRVTALDVSPAGLERARERAGELDVEWIAADLDEPPPVAGGWDLVILFRYVNLPLLADLPRLLAPGGWLLVEEHLRSDTAGLAGPKSPAFRVGAGELEGAVANALREDPALRVIHRFEGELIEPDGDTAALSRLTLWRARPGTQPRFDPRPA